jgi:serine/threonine protein phosphatase PrpC
MRLKADWKTVMKTKSKPQDKVGGLRAGVLSDVGKVRRHNEDAFALLPEQGLCIVSDGMGGHQAGATASKIVVGVLPKMIEQRLALVQREPTKAIPRVIRDTILDLSQQVQQQSASQPGLAQESRKFKGHLTSLTLLVNAEKIRMESFPCRLYQSSLNCHQITSNNQILDFIKYGVAWLRCFRTILQCSKDGSRDFGG